MRLAHEAALIAEAEVDFAAGRLVPAEAVSAWLESLGRHLSDELALERVRTCRFTNAAVRDLDRISRWLTQPGSGPNAHQRLRRLNHAIRALADAPCQWPPGEHSGTRELQSPSFAYSGPANPAVCDRGWRSFRLRCQGEKKRAGRIGASSATGYAGLASQRRSEWQRWRANERRPKASTHFSLCGDSRAPPKLGPRFLP